MTTGKSIFWAAAWILSGCLVGLSSAHADDNRQYALQCLSHFQSYENQNWRIMDQQRELTFEREELAARRQQIESNSQRLLRESREVTNCNTLESACMARIHAHDEIRREHNERNRQLRADEADLAKRIDELEVRRENLSWFRERAVDSCNQSELEDVSYHTWQDACDDREISHELFQSVVGRRLLCR
ncbi:hypothetical protein FM042_09325 [Aliidiomarina halalkaliphila]|uniref:Lysozyme inhibitor LprI N-terminal domain-containing protein n=1 Tax=Aliidiomarina halalkaliphila TaxID=2593535 RepID=A0A552X0G5_9GAMM|nr:hypothetical protein [Aliidiomarina halalkaliphila]TRW48369.1 hypothetical protein FM042_09325 [Aliidiomarina halalkaliphila]